MTKLAGLCGTLLLFAGLVYGQGGGNAALTGTVTDPTGATISQAHVTLTQIGTDVRRTASTNASGQFTISSIPPSNYRLTVEAGGFKTYVQDVTLLADESGALQIPMQLGASTETVTVEATATLVNTTTPVLSQVIEGARLTELPLNGRNAADLTKMVAGAMDSNNGAGTTQGDTKQVPGAEAISVNGARPDQISYNLDGGTNQDLMSNTNNPFPFPDALQEFSVQTNSFDTQYGTNAGAVVNVVTKSGTNQWHGDGFEFVRNRDFNARNFFAATTDPLKRNQYGATIGGPIRKDTTFIFFGYQGTRIRTTGNANNTILPTAANMNGDFSNYLTANPAVNPQAKVIQLVDPTTGNPFPNNQIPVSPVALALSKFLPISQALPNGRLTYGVPTLQNFDEYITRFDRVIRGQDKLYARYYLDKYYHAPAYDGKNLLLTGFPGSTGKNAERFGRVHVDSRRNSGQQFCGNLHARDVGSRAGRQCSAVQRLRRERPTASQIRRRHPRPRHHQRVFRPRKLYGWPVHSEHVRNPRSGYVDARIAYVPIWRQRRRGPVEYPQYGS